MNKLSAPTLVAVALTTIAPLSVHAGTLQSFSTSNGEGNAIGFGSTGCTAWDALLDASNTGTHNLSAPATQGFAFVNLAVFNFCTNSMVFLAGSTSNLQFASAPGTTNNVPKFVNASGTIALTGVSCTATGCSNVSDTVTFSMALQPTADTTSHLFQHTRQTYGGGVTMEQILDANSAIGTGPVSLSSQNFGTMAGSWSTAVIDGKTHMITITFP